MRQFLKFVCCHFPQKKLHCSTSSLSFVAVRGMASPLNPTLQQLQKSTLIKFFEPFIRYILNFRTRLSSNSSPTSYVWKSRSTIFNCSVDSRRAIIWLPPHQLYLRLIKNIVRRIFPPHVALHQRPSLVRCIHARRAHFISLHNTVMVYKKMIVLVAKNFWYPKRLFFLPVI